MTPAQTSSVAQLGCRGLRPKDLLIPQTHGGCDFPGVEQGFLSRKGQTGRLVLCPGLESPRPRLDLPPSLDPGLSLGPPPTLCSPQLLVEKRRERTNGLCIIWPTLAKRPVCPALVI